MTDDKTTETVPVGSVDINKGEHVVQVEAEPLLDIINVFDQDAPRVSAHLKLGRSSEYGRFSYSISLGMDIPVHRGDLASGKAHKSVTDRLGQMSLALVEELEEGWIPEDEQTDKIKILIAHQAENEEE